MPQGCVDLEVSDFHKARTALRSIPVLIVFARPWWPSILSSASAAWRIIPFSEIQARDASSNASAVPWHATNASAWPHAALPATLAF